MPRVTIKSLEEKISNLKFVNDYQINVITKLNAEIDSLKDKENIVPKPEFEILAKQLENQKQVTAEYKKLYEDLQNKHIKMKEELLDKIKNLQDHKDSSETKLNERNAGRKAYSNKEVIELIYKLYIDRKSLQGIADELNSLEIKTNRGKDWSKSSIRFILMNPKNVSNGFIGDDIFNRAVKLLNDNKKYY